MELAEPVLEERAALPIDGAGLLARVDAAQRQLADAAGDEGPGRRRGGDDGGAAEPAQHVAAGGAETGRTVDGSMHAGHLAAQEIGRYRACTVRAVPTKFSPGANG